MTTLRVRMHAGVNRGISWGQRNNYCWEAAPSLAEQLDLVYWKAPCVVPLGKVYWILLLQVIAVGQYT